jgi:hypothetical protein
MGFIGKEALRGEGGGGGGKKKGGDFLESQSFFCSLNITLDYPTLY